MGKVNLNSGKTVPVNLKGFVFWFISLCSYVFPGHATALLPFENTGNLYVSMWSSDDIAVFTPDGAPQGRFSADGLDGPRGIAFNPANGDIWVASEFGNAIFIFDSQHRFLRTLDHPDFDEPVGVTFKSEPGVAASDQSVYVSNSNGNEIMVFDQSGNLQRRFSGTALQDPNCSAFMPDGSLFVANRLGGTFGTSGAVSTFDNSDTFTFDFTTDGIASLMAIARDPNSLSIDSDDSLWITSGAGDNGIYQFDPSGNLLTSLVPAEIDDGRSIVPQGIAFDGGGSFYVVSFLDEVLQFDGDGNFQTRFPTGAGTSRSTAFQGCQAIDNGVCIPFGEVSEASVDEDNNTVGANDNTTPSNMSVSSSGGGKLSGWLLIALISTGGCRRFFSIGEPIATKNR